MLLVLVLHCKVMLKAAAHKSPSSCCAGHPARSLVQSAILRCTNGFDFYSRSDIRDPRRLTFLPIFRKQLAGNLDFQTTLGPPVPELVGVCIFLAVRAFLC